MWACREETEAPYPLRCQPSLQRGKITGPHSPAFSGLAILSVVLQSKAGTLRSSFSWRRNILTSVLFVRSEFPCQIRKELLLLFHRKRVSFHTNICFQKALGCTHLTSTRQTGEVGARGCVGEVSTGGMGHGAPSHFHGPGPFLPNPL